MDTARKCKLHRETVYVIRKQFVHDGLEAVVYRKKREIPPTEPKVTGDVEAHIIAVACSSAPEGKSKWTLQMIADKIVFDGVVDSIGKETVRRTLKKTKYKPHLKQMWCIPPEQNAEFVARMEDIALDVYALPYNSNCPVICIDEKPYQLLDERREPIPMTTGSSKKYDNEYERMGTCSIFVMVEPLTGWHHAHARNRRTAIDFASEINWLLTDEQSPYKNAPKIKIVVDQLNTHGFCSLYKAFPAPLARELTKRIELHFTPKHGSWLNIAEIGISILSKQCIDRRIPSIDMLNQFHLKSWTVCVSAKAARLERCVRFGRNLSLHVLNWNWY